MRKFNFDEIDDVVLQVVRNDMARIYGEPPLIERRKHTRTNDDTGTWNRLPMFLRRQAE